MAQRARGPSFLPRVPTTFLLSVGPSSPHPRRSVHLIQGGYFGTTSKNERHPASTLPSSPKSFVKLECCLPQALPNDKTKTNKQTNKTLIIKGGSEKERMQRAQTSESPLPRRGWTRAYSVCRAHRRQAAASTCPQQERAARRGGGGRSQHVMGTVEGSLRDQLGLLAWLPAARVRAWGVLIFADSASSGLPVISKSL